MQRTTIAAIAAFLLLLFVPHNATAMTDKTYCHGSRIPLRICSAIRHNASKACVRIHGNLECAKPYWGRSWRLAYILKHESGFDPCAVNSLGHSCDYTGTSRSCGLFQRQPCPQDTFPFIGPEVRNGLRYIVGRYRTPAAAYDFWRAHHWY